MSRSDLEDIANAGAAARRDGFSFHVNPHYSVGMEWATVDHCRMPVASAKQHKVHMSMRCRGLFVQWRHSRVNSSSVGSRSRWLLRVLNPRCFKLSRASSASRSFMSSWRACRPHRRTVERKDKSPEIVTPPAPSFIRSSMKSRSVRAFREARRTLPSLARSIARVAPLVLPGNFATVSVYLSIKSASVEPFGTGAKPPAAM